MNLEWKGQENIDASSEKLWAFITDAASIVQCVPDIVESTVLDSNRIDAVVKVGVGPVKGKFKLKIELQPNAGERHMNLKISGGGLGSVVDLIAGAEITDNGDSTTTLDWSGTATMRGPITSVAGRVIDAQALRVISTTFANVKAKCGSGSV